MASKWLGILLGLAIGFLAGACAAAPVAEQPYKIGFGGRFLTTVYVNGQGPFDFLLDTASSKTVLYEHVRKQLKLEPSGAEPIRVIGLSGASESLPYTLTEFKVGQEAIAGLSVVVVPDAAVEPDGVLGIDVLKHYLVVLDAANRQLRLYNPAEDLSAEFDSWREVPLTATHLPLIDEEFWFFAAYFEQQYARTLLDLGAGLTILNWKLARHMGFHEYNFPPAPEQLRDVLGKPSPVFNIKHMTINISGRAWGNSDGFVADAQLFDLLEMADKPAAIIGPGLLKDETIAIDFARHRLYIAPRSLGAR